MSDIYNRPLILRKNSKSSRFMKLSGDGNYFLDKVFRALYISLLFIFNFVMFIYSINAKLIEDGKCNEAVLCIIGGFSTCS